MLCPVAGIVAEYNPFHNGHLYHIGQARELSCADAVVVVLSSDFVQRGEPALIDKWARAKAALLCGANLVIELPAIFSAHNAGVFANAGVDLLEATGTVSHIVFGMESPTAPIDSITSILIEEPKPFKIHLKKNLERGLSYVQSRALAADALVPGAARVLCGSNNTLALAYMMRIKQKRYAMAPVPVKREGSAYNSTELTASASAAAIRAALADGRDDAAMAQLPRPSREILARAIEGGRACVTHARLWDILRAILLRTSVQELAGIAEMREGIEYRMRDAALEASSFEEWVSLCTSKRYPAARVRRGAVHIMLGLTHWTNRAAQRLGPPYIRVLGADGKGRALLREMRQSARLPVVSTYGQAARVSEYAATVARYEALACELWEELIPSGTRGAEHKRKIIFV